MILLGQGGQENCPPPTAPTSQPESSPRKGAVSDYTRTTAMSQDSCGKQGALVPLLTAVITKESQSPPHRAPPASESSPIPGCLSQSTFQTARRDTPCGQQVCPFCLKCIPRTWSRMVPGCGRCSVNSCGINERVRVGKMRPFAEPAAKEVTPALTSSLPPINPVFLPFGSSYTRL